MIIKDSSIGMESARTYTSVSVRNYQASGSILAFPGILGDAYDTRSKQDVSKPEDSEKDPSAKEDAQNAKNDFDSIFNRMRAFATSEAYESKLQKDAMNRIRVECIQFLLYMLFGAKGHTDELSAAEGGGGIPVISEVTETRQYYRSETEETCFSTNGKVVTGDGREIEFELELSMSRSFTEYYEQNITSLRTFTDPLVINIDCPIAEVSDVKISFDLDCDGEADEISALGSNSGYLAVDLNEDGIIGDGSELFGTASGDGFADLSKYDLDGNGWIDEADEIFDRLVIAYIKEDGTQELIKLKDADVGAIYTGSASTQFSINDPATNEERARIRQTGIFFYESGMMGTIQHLDLAQ
ncbi:MAG: hypothetical protein IKO16_01960 [Lachnospiraceae bacterium]|nr:hypothetical protein [Lachnospiraceae bacterium]